MILVALMMKAIGSSETSVLTRATWRHIPKVGLLETFLVQFKLKNKKGKMKNVVFWDVTPCGSCTLRRNTWYFFAAYVGC
jgi:hypothetical protein